MDLSLSKLEKKNLKLVHKIIKKWREILHIDPIWEIVVEVYNSEEVEERLDAAFLNLADAEYYTAILSLSNEIMMLEGEDFTDTLNDVACHELVHLSCTDFYRTALLAANENVEMRKELRYRFEQITSRMQRAFMEMQSKINELEESLKKERANNNASNNMEEMEEE
jgi:hypothetical protein